MREKNADYNSRGTVAAFISNHNCGHRLIYPQQTCKFDWSGVAGDCDCDWGYKVITRSSFVTEIWNPFPQTDSLVIVTHTYYSRRSTAICCSCSTSLSQFGACLCATYSTQPTLNIVQPACLPTSNPKAIPLICTRQRAYNSIQVNPSTRGFRSSCLEN